MCFFMVGHFQAQHLPSIQNQDQLSESICVCVIPKKEEYNGPIVKKNN